MREEVFLQNGSGASFTFVGIHLHEVSSPKYKQENNTYRSVNRNEQICSCVFNPLIAYCYSELLAATSAAPILLTLLI